MRLDRLQEQLRDWIRAHGNSLRLEHRFEQPNPNANKASQGKYDVLDNQSPMLERNAKAQPA